MLRYLFLNIILLSFLSLSAFGTDWYVATNGPGGGSTSWETATNSIQDAINAAAVGEKVWVSNGLYLITNQIMITNRITVTGVNGYSNTLVTPNWPAYTTRCFYVANTGIVDGFTISNGHYMGSNDYTGGGGAMISNAIIQNCYFTYNVCSNAGVDAGGGGAYARSGGIISNCLFVTNLSYYTGSINYNGSGGAISLYDGKALKCTVISNYSNRYGGGIRQSHSSDIISNCFIAYNKSFSTGGGIIGGGLVTDCVISNNIAGQIGGGIDLQSAAALVRNCTIVNNSGYGSGGGVYMWYGTISNCVIAGNRVNAGGDTQRGGGGICIYEKPSTIDSCLISNNINFSVPGGGGIRIAACGQVRNCLIQNNTNAVGAYGGGVYLTNAALITTSPYGLINCTIVNNWSTNDGGGIATFGPSNYIANCVIANNSSYSNNYPDVYNTGENSNNYWYSCATNVSFTPNQGNKTNDPVFKDAAASNWRLKSGSPCVNAGTNQSWMTGGFDLDGRPRIRYGRVDMGAYEYWEGPYLIRKGTGISSISGTGISYNKGVISQ